MPWDWLRRDWKIGTPALLWIGFAAVLVKVLLLFVVLPLLHNASPTTYQADRFPDWYDMLARNLAEGHGYRFYPDTTPTMLRNPGWPVVLAGIFSLFGYGITAVKVFNVLCSIGTGVLTFVLGERLTRHRLLALLAALIAFLHPAVIVADSRGGVESLFMLLMMGFMVLVHRAFINDSLRTYLIAGLLLGAVLLVKSTAALFVPVVFLCQLLARRNWDGFRRAVVTTTVMSLVAGVMLVPWIVRNFEVSGRFVPTASVGSMAAWCGLYISSNRHTGLEQHELDLEASNEMGRMATELGLKFRPGYYPQFYTVEEETRFFRHLGEVVRERYREQPSLFLHVLADNAAGFWVRGRTMKATTLNAILVVPFVLLTVVGAVVGARRGLVVLPAILFVGAFYAPHITILGQARYHVPLIPLLAILLTMAFLPLLSPARPSGSSATKVIPNG